MLSLRKDQRKFMMTNLSNLGIGKKNTIEDIVIEEIEGVEELFLKEMREKGSVSMFRRYGPAINNVIWRIATGKRTKQNDPELIQLTQCVSEMFDAAAPMGNVIGLLQLSSEKFLNFCM